MPNNSNKRKKRPQNSSTRTKSNKSRTTQRGGGTSRPTSTGLVKVDTKKRKRNKKFNKIKTLLKLAFVICLFLCVVGAGIVAAMFFGLFGEQFEITKEELTVGVSNSIVLDKAGNEIANLSKDEKRKTITMDEMAEYLPKSYIAIEDKRFYDHSGVDLKRTTGAILGVITGKNNGGGSTITQQLVKNITQEKARTGMAGYTRKIKEWSKAVQVERMISKDQILELYLNIIFVGGNELHGVELGSIYYFNKSAKDLDLAECAFLAGINNSPNSYNPYDTTKDNTEVIKKRTLTVLNEMKEQNLIENEEDYNNAVKKVEDGLQFTKGDTGSGITYSYHTAAAIDQVVEQVMKDKNMTKQIAENYVYTSGLTIYSTEDPEIQKAVEEEFAKTKYQIAGKEKDANGELKNDHTQAALVIIDNATGQVVAVGGSLGNTSATGWNRGTQMIRQTGSSMKIIADIAPGLQERIITAATIYDDSLTSFNGYPPNDYNTPKGYINIRSCIRTSQNIPMVKVMVELTPKKAIEYLRNMGITTLDDERDNALPLSIGGLDQGVSPLEMAAAYETISNDGVYTTPIFYTKVVDANGNTILTASQEKRRVLTEQNAYITRSIAEEPVNSGGTATYCKIKGMETCAKTGSTDKYKDRWLCGMTPYYTAACWFGYDSPETMNNISVDGRNPAGQIWAQVMTKIHTNLENKNFNKPSGIVTATICKTTGCIATASCTDTYTEIFTSDNMPTKCQGHGVQDICEESGKLATEYCPNHKNVAYGGVIPKEQLGLWKKIGAGTITVKEMVEEVCDIHQKPEEKPETVDEKANKDAGNDASPSEEKSKEEKNSGNSGNSGANSTENTTGNATNTGGSSSANTTENKETNSTETTNITQN